MMRYFISRMLKLSYTKYWKSIKSAKYVIDIVGLDKYKQGNFLTAYLHNFSTMIRAGDDGQVSQMF